LKHHQLQEQRGHNQQEQNCKLDEQTQPAMEFRQ
jgi:hypothetical protein